MSELAYRMWLAAKKSAAATTPKLGDFVRFAHPLHPAWGTLSGFVIMIITEVDKPPRCEVLVRYGNTGYPTFFWRRAAQLTVLANAKPENHHRIRYPVRHQEEQAGETS